MLSCRDSAPKSSRLHKFLENKHCVCDDKFLNIIYYSCRVENFAKKYYCVDRQKWSVAGNVRELNDRMCQFELYSFGVSCYLFISPLAH